MATQLPVTSLCPPSPPEQLLLRLPSEEKTQLISVTVGSFLFKPPTSIRAGPRRAGRSCSSSPLLLTAAHSAQQVWSIGHFLFSATEELSVDALAPIISAS